MACAIPRTSNEVWQILQVAAQNSVRTRNPVHLKAPRNEPLNKAPQPRNRPEAKWHECDAPSGLAFFTSAVCALCAGALILCFVLCESSDNFLAGFLLITIADGYVSGCSV